MCIRDRHGFIAVRPEIQTFDPRRCPSHLPTDGVQGYVHTALDDQLIVDMADDKTVGQRPHGVHENIPGDGLDDVLPVSYTHLDVYKRQEIL